MKSETQKNLLCPLEEFSPMPFWFWNDRLDEAEIISQIREMNSKGVNGFIIHPRIGIPRDIPYMSEKYMGYVRCAVEEADRLGMKVILYDEGMYPSGAAHGMVVEKHPEFATRGIRCERSLCSEPGLEPGERLLRSFTAKIISDTGLTDIREYTGKAPGDGYAFIHLIEGFTHGHIRGIHIGEDDWEEPPRSADILSFGSVRCFIELTHEVYYRALSKYFGSTVIGIFTDEPSVLGRGEDKRMQPWTVDLRDELESAGIALCDIPALWYDVGADTERIRRGFKDAVRSRLANSYYKQLYDWCESHGIALVGHPGKSWDIGLLKYFHVPGQDLVFRRVAPEDDKALSGFDSTQAKCSSDSARHRGRRRNLNECFACGGRNGIEWSFSAGDMKWMMDWLFVRGVNMLVPHAFFYSLDGERRFGERPPDVGINSIWWKHYDGISAYIKRMCYMLTDSYNTTEIAVLCRSAYLPCDIVRPLYEAQLEFNYLEAELLSDGSCAVSDGRIRIRSQSYSTLILEDASYISPEVESFARGGGRVIVYAPDGVCDSKGVICVSAYEDMLPYLERDLVIAPPCKDLRVSHIVKNGEHFYILTNEGEEPVTGEVGFSCGGGFSVFDPWRGAELDISGGAVSLDRRGSLIICAGGALTERASLSLAGSAGTPARETVLDSWYIGTEKVKPGSWTENEKLKDFCGTVSYRTELDMDIKAADKVILDMGEVAEQAEVYINGSYAGYRLWAPYVIDVTEHMISGRNTLRIDVTNSLANKYGKERLPSGLLGRVVLKVY